MGVARIGFVGVGGVAGGHLSNIRGMEDAELVALCDINADLLARRAQENHVERTYADFRTMLSKEDLDAVYVCVPPFAHGDIEDHIIAKGCALFVEKPVELDMNAAIRKHEAIQKAGILNAVGYCVRYQHTVDTLLRHLKEVKVEVALGYYMGGAPGGWWQIRSKSGGQLVEQTTHILDLARFVVGDVVAVAGGYVTRTPLNDTADVENASIAQLFFENGAIGTITSACMISMGYKTGLDLFAKDFIAEYNYSTLRIRSKGDSQEFQNDNNMYLEEDLAFIEAVRTGDRSNVRSDYADGVKTLEVSLLAREAFENRTVLETTFRG